jgi:hypothetical protein
VFAHRWIVSEPVPGWWFEAPEAGFRLPAIAQTLADRDARLAEAEAHITALQGRQAALLGLVERTACTLETVGGAEHAAWLREQSETIVINPATSVRRAEEPSA